MQPGPNQAGRGQRRRRATRGRGGRLSARRLPFNGRFCPKPVKRLVASSEHLKPKRLQVHRDALRCISVRRSYDLRGYRMASSPTTSGEHPPPSRQASLTTARAGAAVCLLIPILAALWVPSYARTTPALGGVPFFYWYQLALLPLGAALTGVAYLLLRRAENKSGRGREQ
ncbi:DUF3311 domain-containing protein [Streptomyces sp. 7N604]|uniref:DUF3311 domain-containing protein n=1 Tax=Streptomyces sp. 7N604 TaxID=3457415 RepID=UPI003FD39F1D